MPRSLQGRRAGGQAVRPAQIRQRARRGALLAPCRRHYSAPRLIGLPVTVTAPRLSGIRWRFCSRWDEQPAAELGKSLLRLGICRIEDWSGSAVDFIERGFRRFARANGADEAKRVWSGELRIADYLYPLSEPERNQMEADAAGPTEKLFLVGEYHAAASIPIGAALADLEREHQFLPAAFYKILVHNLWKWMRVYDYSDAVEHSDAWLSELDEDEEANSLYRKVKENVPPPLAASSSLSERTARKFLREFGRSIRNAASRRLVQRLLELDCLGKGWEHAWAGNLIKQNPEVEQFLDSFDGCGPGCLISWQENDEIQACFDEEMRSIGQEGPLEPPIVLAMPLKGTNDDVDRVVSQAFHYAGTMVRSLAKAAEIVEIIREVDDEHLRQHRLQPGIPAQPSPTGVREEQL